MWHPPLVMSAMVNEDRHVDLSGDAKYASRPETDSQVQVLIMIHTPCKHYTFSMGLLHSVTCVPTAAPVFDRCHANMSHAGLVPACF